MMNEMHTKRRSARKTRSEELFETYLGSLGAPFDYESDFGGKHPDYALKSENGDHVALIEVEEFITPSNLPDDFRPDSNGRIREKINSARDHFSRAKQLPCLLVLYDNCSPVHLDEDTVFAAMLGDLTISVPLALNVQTGATELQESSVIFGRNGKMRQGNNVQNTTISAVAILETVHVDQHRSGYLRDVKELHFDDGASMQLIYQAVARLEQDYRTRGVDFERIAHRLRIFKNPFARIEWPESLRSDADEIWGMDAEKRLVKLFDGLAPP